MSGGVFKAGCCWAHNSNTTACLPRLAANFTGAGGFLLGLRDALIHAVGAMVHREAQRAKLLLNLHHLEALPGLLSKLRDDRLRVRSEPPSREQPKTLSRVLPKEPVRSGLGAGT